MDLTDIKINSFQRMSMNTSQYVLWEEKDICHEQ